MSVFAWKWQPSVPIPLTCVSWNTHGVTSSLLGPGPGVLGLELDGEGGPLRSEASFMELFLFRDPLAPGAKGGKLPCIELDSEFCRLPSFCRSLYSSPKKLCSFFWNLPPILDLEPEEDTVLALAIDGRRSSPSGKVMPLCGAKPGDTCPRLSVESL